MRLLGNRFKKLQCLPLFLLTWASFTHSGSSLGPIRECCPHRSLPDCPTPQCPQDWVLYQEGRSETSGSGHGLPGTFCPLHQTTDCHCSARSVTACSLCRPAQPGLHPHQHASAPHRNQEHYTVLLALTATLYLQPAPGSHTTWNVLLWYLLGAFYWEIQTNLEKMLSDHQDKQKQKHGSRGQWGELVHGHQTPMLLDSAAAPGIASYVEVEAWAAAVLLLWLVLSSEPATVSSKPGKQSFVEP